MSIPIVVPQSPADASLMDLTGKARIRHAALQLFAGKGYSQASLRRIAQRANVSLALIGHHFGSKLHLREAIDQWVVRRLGEAAVNTVDLRAPLADVVAQLTRAYQAALEVEPDMRAYLRRTVLEDARGEAPVLALFLEQIRQILSRTSEAARATGIESWAPWSTQIFVQVFGSLVLEPALRRDRARHGDREPHSVASSGEAGSEEGRRLVSAPGLQRPRGADTVVVPFGLVQLR